jgi:hypothetical protein
MAYLAKPGRDDEMAREVAQIGAVLAVRFDRLGEERLAQDFSRP